MRQLGQVMYDTHRGREDSGDQVPGLLEKADEVSGRIEQMKDRIAAARQSRPCPECGASCGRDDQFCRSCGAKL